LLPFTVLGLVLQHLLHHQLHLIHALLHHFQALISVHAGTTCLGTTGIGRLLPGLVTHSTLATSHLTLPLTLPHHSLTLALTLASHAATHHLHMLLHVFHMLFANTLALFIRLRIAHFLPHGLHLCHVLIHLLHLLLVHHATTGHLTGIPLGKNQQWSRNENRAGD